MFDDIVTNTRTKKEYGSENNGEICPYCKSTKVDIVDGVFVRAGIYTETVQCVVCQEKWSVVYDSDLNIIEVKLGA